MPRSDRPAGRPPARYRRQPQQSGGDTGSLLGLGVHAGVRHRGRMGDQRLHPAWATRPWPKTCSPSQNAFTAGSPPDSSKLIIEPKPVCWSRPVRGRDARAGRGSARGPQRVGQQRPHQLGRIGIVDADAGVQRARYAVPTRVEGAGGQPEHVGPVREFFAGGLICGDDGAANHVGVAVDELVVECTTTSTPNSKGRRRRRAERVVGDGECPACLAADAIARRSTTRSRGLDGVSMSTVFAPGSAASGRRGRSGR